MKFKGNLKVDEVTRTMKFKGNLKVDEVTRIEVITPQGRSYIYRDNSKGEPLAIEMSMQDNGKTMKLYVEHTNPCKTCNGSGVYMEDVVGDGGRFMEQPCDDCNANNPLTNGK
jgi:DnaJ-class molecular chaperone